MSIGEFEPRSKAAAAYERLRHEIRIGDRRPGDRITLQDLSNHLGMSLTPIREALSKLESEGFVEHRRHHGTHIAGFSRARMEQTYRLRKVLEPMAVRLAAERVLRTEPQVDVDHVAARLLACERADTAIGVVQANEEFHRALYGLSGDPLLQDFIEKLWTGVPYQSLSLYEGGPRVSESAAEHRQILDAVLSGMPELAERLLLEHIEHGQDAAAASL